MLVVSAVVWVAATSLVLSADTSGPGGGSKLAKPPEKQTTVPVAKSQGAADFPVIGYLEKRDRTITVKAGPNSPVYSVKTADGKVLCDNLSREQLSAQAPELSEFLKTAVADAPGAKTNARVHIKLDASVRDLRLR